MPFGIGPNTAFVLAIFGVLGIYCEFIWPGRIYPLVLGSGTLVTGCFFLWRLSPSPLSLALVAAAVLLFLVDLLWNTYFVSALLATACLAVGFCEMFHTPPWIVAGLAIPVCCVFGAVTCFLSYSARRSREKKWSDVQ